MEGVFRYIHHAEMLPVEYFSCVRMQDCEVGIEDGLADDLLTFITKWDSGLS